MSDTAQPAGWLQPSAPRLVALAPGRPSADRGLVSETPNIQVDQPTFARALGPVEGTSIVIGTVIGSGIFVVPASIARDAGAWGFGTILLIWVVCGLLSLAGALSYAELSSMFPRAGGQYVYLRESYGSLWAFLFGWMEFWVARSGSVAALAVAFARYAGVFTHQDGDWGLRWTAFIMIFSLTVVNYLGVRWGGTVQVLFTATKVAALGALIVCAFALPGGSPHNWQPWFANGPGGLSQLLVVTGTVMISVLWAYDGWANGAAVSEEMKQPQRDVPRALFFGTLTIMALYLLANVAYHFTLPMAQVAGTERVAAAVAERLFGGAVKVSANDVTTSVGAGLVSAAVMISTFGATNGLMLTGPRIFYAMSRDQVFFHEMGELHRRFRTPHWAILFQGLWAGLLVLVPFNDLLNGLFHWHLDTPLYDQLITYVIFPSWAFYGMTVAGVFILRRTRPELERPYRAWGYPVLPALFILTALAFVAHTLFHQPAEALAGLGIIALGLPAHAAWSRGRNRT